MSKVAIVYWSGTGNTETMANLIAEGALGAGAQVDLYTASDFTPELADGYPVIAFGCPAMGSEQLEETEFEPMFTAVKPKLNGKGIALFGSYSWADGEWMRIWAQDYEDAGLRLVADPVTAYDAPDADVSEACRELGRKLAAG